MASAALSYLYTLATLSITFVGFSALVIVFRQTLGGDLSMLDILLTKIFVQLGFIVVASALLPPLLILLQFSELTTWRVSSAVSAFSSLVFAVSYPTRRRAASGDPTPWFVWVDVGVLLLAATLLTANAAAVGVEMGAGPYAAALTMILYVSFFAYLQALATIHRKHLGLRKRAE